MTVGLGRLGQGAPVAMAVCGVLWLAACGEDTLPSSTVADTGAEERTLLRGMSEVAQAERPQGGDNVLPNGIAMSGGSQPALPLDVPSNPAGSPAAQTGARIPDAGAPSTEEGTVPADSPPSEGMRPSWSTYGFDARNSQHNPLETTLGVFNVAQLSEQWRWHMPDGATSTPAIQDGIAYFGGWDGKVYAVDAERGELRWQQRVSQGQANSTPLVAGERVYVAAGAALVALSKDDGEVIYEVALDTHPAAMIWSSPKMIDGMLVIGVASFENGISYEPTFVGSVVALEAADGTELWRVKTTGEPGFGPCHGGPGAAVWSSAAFDEALGLMYIGTGQGYLAPARAPIRLKCA